jgi:CRP-like cAMP-binding protein
MSQFQSQFHVRQPDVRNRLLAALPPGDFALLAPSLRPVELELRQVLHAPDEPIAAAYFPEAGMVSMIAALEDGAFQEVGLVGREGLVGLAVVLGADSTPIEALVQAPGPALRMPAAELVAAFERSTTLRAALLAFMQAFHLQVTRTAACNGRHALEERLARWLLMAHDRAESDRFPMTQEFMAMMLGVRRAGVSVAAGTLRQAGVVNYARGCVTILDRPGLEAASCGCYRAAREQAERLLGGGGGTAR